MTKIGTLEGMLCHCIQHTPYHVLLACRVLWRRAGLSMLELAITQI